MSKLVNDYTVRTGDGRLVTRREEHLHRELIVKDYIRLRKEKGLTQQDIADRSGIARSNISRLEKGGTTPSLEVLDRIAKALNMELKVQFIEEKK